MYENTTNNKILKIPVCLFGFGVQETDLFITWCWIMFKHNHQLTYTKWFCGIWSSHGYRRGLSPPSDVVSRLKPHLCPIYACATIRLYVRLFVSAASFIFIVFRAADNITALKQVFNNEEQVSRMTGADF